MARAIQASTWRKYQNLRDAGMSRREAAKRVNITYTSAARFDRGEVATSESEKAVAAIKIVEDEAIVPPKSLEELDRVALDALTDFELFRKRYLGRDSKPWQVMAGDRMVELEDTEDREWVVVNVPPGSGKSTTFTHDLVLWIITRNRVFDKTTRIMVGSRTQRQANQYGRRLRATLERARPMEGADGVLRDDYGEYKPMSSKLWRSEEFMVWENPELQPTDDKEPTVMCVGMDTGFLGGRFDFVIWDDLVDNSTIRTEESRATQREWFDDIAESRLEPGGVFILQGQRLSPDDLYRYALNKEQVDDEGNPTGKSKYRHIVFPAHDESKCAEEHSRKAPAWPDGCLLDPIRLSWRDLMTVKKNNPRKFDIIMQQKDVDPEGVLVPLVFIEGGNFNGMELPGCLDYDRQIASLSGLPQTDLISAISVDPSPTKFWSMQWWAYDPETEFRYLLDQYRGIMDAPDFLDRLTNGRYVGIAEEWVQRASDMGLPVDTLIVEQNAAQRFLLQHDYVQRWSGMRSVSIIPHSTTHSNKASEEFGVQTLRPHYQFGRVRLPYDDPYTRSIVQPLIDEVTVWPEGRTDDCVMAQWMFEWNLPDLTLHSYEFPRITSLPSWVA